IAHETGRGVAFHRLIATTHFSPLAAGISRSGRGTGSRLPRIRHRPHREDDVDRPRMAAGGGKELDEGGRGIGRVSRIVCCAGSSGWSKWHSRRKAKLMSPAFWTSARSRALYTRYTRGLPFASGSAYESGPSSSRTSSFSFA